MVVVRYVKVKSLLSPTKLGADFVINPYVGCPHGCVYCYAACMRGAAERGEPWGSYLDVKCPAAPPNLAKLYRRSVLLSSMTDAYNPYEERAGVTRALLRSLVPAQPDVVIITKSALVSRDVDIFREFPRVKAVFSFSSTDDDFRRRAEPHASSPARKLAAMETLRGAGVEVGVMAAPIFPGITDCAKIIEACAPFASSMTFDTLNLRAGNRDKILNFVKSLRPGLAPLYRRIYTEGDRAYWRELRARIEADCRARGLKFSIFF